MTAARSPRDGRAQLLLGVAVLGGIIAAVAAARGLRGADASPLAAVGGRRLQWTAGIAASAACYGVALVLLRRRAAANVAAVVAIAVAVQLAPLAAPTLLSRDVFVYWDYGRIAAVHGGNPYTDLPERWPRDPAYARMGSDWHRTYDAYGPAWTLVAQADADLAGPSPRDAARIFRLVAALGALALVAAVLAAAEPDRRAFAAAFVGWNPLLALHFAGGGHNDAWLMAFALAAVAAADARRRLVAGVAWVLGIAVKWLPLVLLPLELARLRRRFALAEFAAAAAAAAAASSAFYGVWWTRALVPIANQLRRSSTVSSTYWLGRVGVAKDVSTVALFVAFAAAYAWLLREAWRGRRRYALTLGLFALSLSWLTPWYATWPLAFGAVEDDAFGQLLGLALSAYLLVDAIPH